MFGQFFPLLRVSVTTRWASAAEAKPVIMVSNSKGSLSGQPSMV